MLIGDDGRYDRARNVLRYNLFCAGDLGAVADRIDRARMISEAALNAAGRADLAGVADQLGDAADAIRDLHDALDISVALVPEGARDVARHIANEIAGDVVARLLDLAGGSVEAVLAREQERARLARLVADPKALAAAIAEARAEVEAKPGSDRMRGRP